MDVYERVPSHMVDHNVSSFRPPMPSRPVQQPQRQIRFDSQVPAAYHVPAAAQIPAAVQEDLDDDSEMWNMFVDEVKEEDSRITEAWKEDANSIVTFTGLFSAIVGAFIIEFYKKLSSDSGEKTVALLQQISRQLPNSPNSDYSNTVNQPSPPGTSLPGTAIVWVNTLWLISLVLSLSCALIATLLQQWARRYMETPKNTSSPRHCARVRSLLLDGARLYKIPFMVEILPTLLHLSVYLFLGGLVITFHTIHKTVAIAVDAAVGISGLAYIALSILPCLDVKCPYRTPISKILWYPCHTLLSMVALCLHWCLLGLNRLLNRPVRSRGQGVLLRWLKSRGFSVKNHWRFLTDDLEKNIAFRAVTTLKDEDGRRVTWLFNQLALGNKLKLLKFATIIPRRKIPDLMPHINSDSFQDFQKSLLDLFRSCVASRYATGAHRQPLLVCLHAIRHFANETTIPNLNIMRADFANTDLMQPLWSDPDESIRITSRSICALVARQVVRKQRLERGDLSWLQEVTGESSNSILRVRAKATVLDQLDHMNFKSFVNGVLPNNVPHRDLSAEDATSFNKTLASFLGITTNSRGDFTTPGWETRLSEFVGGIQQYDREGGSEVFDKLRLVFPSLPPITSAHAVVPPSPSIPPPSPRVRPIHPRATPSPPPPSVYPPRTNRPSHRAHRHHAQM